MEFTDVGIIPYEAVPPEDMKPFFRRKFKTLFRYLSVIEAHKKVCSSKQKSFRLQCDQRYCYPFI